MPSRVKADAMPSPEPLAGRCGAQTRDGGYCTQWPVGGCEYGKRCRMHGGRLPKHLRGHGDELSEPKSSRRWLGSGLAEVDPHTALLEEVHPLAGNVAWLRRVFDEHTWFSRWSRTAAPTSGQARGLSCTLKPMVGW
jgi:hypothetical protein